MVTGFPHWLQVYLSGWAMARMYGFKFDLIAGSGAGRPGIQCGLIYKSCKHCRFHAVSD
jgi:hypothetical protein